MKFYSYGNIVRILRYSTGSTTSSMMVDVNLDDATILSVFDGTKPFDKSFIEIFLKILPSPTCGFKEVSSTEITSKAVEIAKGYFNT